MQLAFQEAKVMSFLKYLLATACMAVVFTLGGCASPALPEAMTVKLDSGAAVNPRLKGAVALGQVSGGEATNPLWVSQVDNDSFRKAFEASLASYGYLAPDAASAKYSVSAKLFKLDQPMFGLTLDVKSNVVYEVAGQGVTKSYPVNSTGTATFSDAAVAVQRLRLSNERSILENIREFLKQLASF
jgi:hypothetical protein